MRKLVDPAVHAAFLVIVATACATGTLGTTDEWETTTAELAGWAKGNFSQVLRVNAGATSVVNICELTVPLSSVQSITFQASGASSPATATLAWAGSAVSTAGLSINGCSSYPCDVIARWKETAENGTAAGCQIIADDGVTRLVGQSSGTAFAVTSPPEAPVIFNQDVKIGPSGSAIAGSCVLRQSTQAPDAEVTEFTLSVNGGDVVYLPGPIAVGNSPWPTDGPPVPFGTLHVGSELDATRLKHVTARKDQVIEEGDTLRCAGEFSSNGLPIFDVNITGAASGNGVSISREPTCQDGDGQCPTGCLATNDADCAGCGNGLVEPALGETCDGNCPTCSAGGACFTAQTGSAATCDLVCPQPKLACGGSGTSDSCCVFQSVGGPCGGTADADCKGSTWRVVTYGRVASSGGCVIRSIYGMEQGGSYVFTACHPGVPLIGDPQVTRVFDPTSGVEIPGAAQQDCSMPLAVPRLAGYDCSGTNGPNVGFCTGNNTGGFINPFQSFRVDVEICSENGGPFDFTMYIFHNSIQIPTIG